MQIVGIGTDIVECLRIGQMIEKHAELFLSRVYTEAEIRYCQARKNAVEHFAGRWAAKEAVLKCLGTGWSKGLCWTDIEVCNEPNGRPRIQLQAATRDFERVADAVRPQFHLAFVEVRPDRRGGQAGDGQAERQELHELTLFHLL